MGERTIFAFPCLTGEKQGFFAPRLFATGGIGDFAQQFNALRETLFQAEQGE
jgi:hypothetical protein